MSTTTPKPTCNIMYDNIQHYNSGINNVDNDVKTIQDFIHIVSVLCVILFIVLSMVVILLIIFPMNTYIIVVIILAVILFIVIISIVFYH